MDGSLDGGRTGPDPKRISPLKGSSRGRGTQSSFGWERRREEKREKSGGRFCVFGAKVLARLGRFGVGVVLCYVR